MQKQWDKCLIPSPQHGSGLAETRQNLQFWHMSTERFQRAIEAFDALNARDPNEIIEPNGNSIPRELHDARAMSRWIDTLYPDAPEEVRLAARCQHLCRWEIPRNTYPEGRAGYLKWRNDLKQFHADRSEQVLRELGYEEALILEVRKMNLKSDLSHNANVQAIEDALCLVFLETQLEHYLDQWTDVDKVIRILRKTWGKMSEIARSAALELPLSDRARSLIQQALSGQD